MKRRTFLTSLLVGGVGVTFGLEQKANAGGHGAGTGCGTGYEDVEEEFLNLARVGSNAADELSHFFTERLNVSATERFGVADQGRVVVYSDLDVFRVRTKNGKLYEIASPNGGKIILSEQLTSAVLQLRTLSAYDRIIVANGISGEHSFWDDAYGIRQIVATPIGLVVSHGSLGSTEGRLSVVTGEGQTRELVRTEVVPQAVCVNATHVAYFLGERSFVLGLDGTGSPESFGRLPEPPTAAAFARSTLHAITTDGAWAFRKDGKPLRTIAEQDSTNLFEHHGRLVVASRRRVWIHHGVTPLALEFPNANLNFVAPIQGSDDLILCRGPSILRYRSNAQRLERIGQGRPAMKLRGAALVGDKVLTWSTRTWRTSGWDCRVQQPPRTFLVD